MSRFRRLYGAPIVVLASLIGLTAGGTAASSAPSPSSTSDTAVDYLTLPGDSLEQVVLRAAQQGDPTLVSKNLRHLAAIEGGTFLSPSSPLRLTADELRSIADWLETGSADPEVTNLLTEQASPTSHAPAQGAISPPSGYNLWGAHSFNRRAWFMNYEIYLASCGIFGCDVDEHHTFKHTINPGNYYTRFDTTYQRIVTEGRVGRPSFEFAKWDGSSWNGFDSDVNMFPGSWSTTVWHSSAVLEEWAMETVDTMVSIDGQTEVVYLHGGENYCINPSKDPLLIPCVYADYGDTLATQSPGL